MMIAKRKHLIVDCVCILPIVFVRRSYSSSRDKERDENLREAHLRAFRSSSIRNRLHLHYRRERVS